VSQPALSAYLINTARGKLYDRYAIAAALESGQLAVTHSYSAGNATKGSEEAECFKK
jgi:lactate dehydrogenase-like 2-hydroxyacid dehydrogenase